MKEVNKEFYLNLVVIIAVTFALCMDKVSAEVWAAVLTAIGGAYTLGRSYVKGGNGAGKPPVTPTE